MGEQLTIIDENELFVMGADAFGGVHVLNHDGEPLKFYIIPW